MRRIEKTRAWAVVHKGSEDITYEMGGRLWLFTDRKSAKNEVISRFYNGRNLRYSMENVVEVEIRREIVAKGPITLTREEFCRVRRGSVLKVGKHLRRVERVSKMRGKTVFLEFRKLRSPSDTTLYNWTDLNRIARVYRK